MNECYEVLVSRLLVMEHLTYLVRQTALFDHSSVTLGLGFFFGKFLLLFGLIPLNGTHLLGSLIVGSGSGSGIG